MHLSKLLPSHLSLNFSAFFLLLFLPLHSSPVLSQPLPDFFHLVHRLDPTQTLGLRCLIDNIRLCLIVAFYLGAILV